MNIRAELLKVLFKGLSDDEKKKVSELFDNDKKFADVKCRNGKTLRYDGDTPVKGAKAVIVDADGKESPAPDGSHECEDGTTIVTKAGLIESVEKAEAPGKDEEMAKEVAEKLAAIEKTIAEKDAALATMKAEMEAASKLNTEKVTQIAKLMAQFAKLPTETDPTPPNKNLFQQAKDSISAFREDLDAHRRGQKKSKIDLDEMKKYFQKN